MNATTLPGVQIGTNGGGSSVSKGTERQSRDGDPCPCVKCDTQKVYETRYLSKTRLRDDDVQVTVRRKMFICGGSNTVKIECEEELKRLKSGSGSSNGGGMNGLSCNCTKPSYGYESRM